MTSGDSRERARSRRALKIFAQVEFGLIRKLQRDRTI